jgi:hypothetical protein
MKMQSVPVKSDKKNLVSAENIKYVPRFTAYKTDYFCVEHLLYRE